MFLNDGRKKVLFGWPEFPITFWGFQYSLPFIGLPFIRPKKAAIPPLGLATVAALFPRDHYQVKIIDMNIERLTDKMISEADLIGLSGMLIQKNSFDQVAARCKQMGKLVIAGGPYAISSHEDISNVDSFILGEGEVNIPPFLEDFKGGGKVRSVYNDLTKADMTLSPLPRFDLLKLKNYGSAALQISRGCPNNCEFCDIIEMFGREMRMKSADQVIVELNLLFALGVRDAVFIVDDNFIGHKQKVKTLLAKIIQWQRQYNYPFDFFTECSIDLAGEDELLDLMVKAGFNMVFIGIETPDRDTLMQVGKLQNTKLDMLEAVKKIQSRGIEVSGGFIIGFDSDKLNIFQRQIEFIQESGIVRAMVGLLQALPNTRLYKRLEAEDRLLSDVLLGNNTGLGLNFRPVMDSETLLAGYKKIIASIYDPKSYLDRCITFFKNWDPHQHSVRKVRLEEIYSLIVSLIRQGNPGSGYWRHYLTYLKDALAINPRVFPEAVRQAIMGHHFFKVTERILSAR